MAVDRRMKDQQWYPADENGDVPSWERVNLAVLMDIRDELKRLNAAIYCHNFQDIPSRLLRIVRNTHRPKKRRVAR